MESIPVTASEDRILQALWKAEAPMTSAALARATGEDVSVAWNILRRLRDGGLLATGGTGQRCVYQLTRAGADYACQVVPVDAPGGPALPNQIRARAAAWRDAEFARIILAVAARRGWPEGWPATWRAVALARMNNPDMTWREIGAIVGCTRNASRRLFDRFFEAAQDAGYLTARQSR
jgi:hypothetical protein